MYFRLAEQRVVSAGCSRGGAEHGVEVLGGPLRSERSLRKDRGAQHAGNIRSRIEAQWLTGNQLRVELKAHRHEHSWNDSGAALGGIPARQSNGGMAGVEAEGRCGALCPGKSRCESEEDQQQKPCNSHQETMIASPAGFTAAFGRSVCSMPLW